MLTNKEVIKKIEAGESINALARDKWKEIYRKLKNNDTYTDNLYCSFCLTYPCRICPLQCTTVWKKFNSYKTQENAKKVLNLVNQCYTVPRIKRVSSNHYRVQSSSLTKKWYDVYKLSDDTYACRCDSYFFKTGVNIFGECKHIQRIKTLIEYRGVIF